MEVLLLTTLFSVVFAILFLTLFLRERQVRRFGGMERDALMPLDDGDLSDHRSTTVAFPNPSPDPAALPAKAVGGSRGCGECRCGGACGGGQEKEKKSGGRYLPHA